jgi:hypothetical protein
LPPEAGQQKSYGNDPVNLSPQDKELLRRIDEVLHYLWDPIGIAGWPQCRDEYESYVPHVFQLLKRTGDGREVAEYLYWLSTERICMEANRGHDAEVVRVLLSWRDHLAD